MAVKLFRLTALAIFLTFLFAACGKEEVATSGTEAPVSKGAEEKPGTTSASEQSGVGRVIERKIVKDASISLSVKNVQDSIDTVTSIARRSGGFVSKSNIRSQENQEVADITVRVPASELDPVMGQLRRLALKVTKETTDTKDVTEEFTDLESRLRNLQATESQFLDVLKQTKNIDEILKVQDRLNNVQGQIEQTKGRMNLIENLSDLATIQVNLLPEALAKDQAIRHPLRAARNAWDASLIALRIAASAVTATMVFLWWLLPLLPIAALVAWRFWRASSMRIPPRPEAPTGQG